MLGTGASGQVVLCVHKATKIHYALKTIKKKSIKSDKYDGLRSEIQIMQDLDHPNILRIHEFFETKTAIHLVLEICRGGELLSRLHVILFIDDSTLKKYKRLSVLFV